MKEIKYLIDGEYYYYPIEQDELNNAIWDILNEQYFSDLDLDARQYEQLREKILDFVSSYDLTEELMDEIKDYFRDSAYEYFGEREEYEKALERLPYL